MNNFKLTDDLFVACNKIVYNCDCNHCTFRLKVVFNSYGIILSVRASVCQRFIIRQNDTNPGSLFRGIQPHYEKKDPMYTDDINTFLKELRI